MIRVSTNLKLIERQSKIARYATFAGLGVLLVSLISSFVNVSNIVFSYISLFIGLIFAYIGSTLANKWIRAPRADNALAKALKGFDNKHHLYNYLLPASHVLLAPTGLLIFFVKPLDGEITCRDDKWKRPWRWTRLFGGLAQEPLGNPSADLRRDIESMRGLLGEKFAQVPVEGYIVFSDPKVELDIHNASVPVVRTDDLKETLRKAKRGSALQPQLLNELEKVLDDQANVQTTK